MPTPKTAGTETFLIPRTQLREETDRALRSFLARRGTKKGDISRFVEEAVQSRLFELTVEGVKERNQQHDQNETLEAIEDALAGA